MDEQHRINTHAPRKSRPLQREMVISESVSSARLCRTRGAVCIVAMAEGDEDTSTPFTLALIAGGIAGTTVDVALYPLDALKTRLQSPAGFWKAGGFSGIYRGVLATALGASPGSAMFFSACACTAK